MALLLEHGSLHPHLDFHTTRSPDPCYLREASQCRTLIAHRAECAGILGALVSLKRLLTQWNVSGGTVIFSCDNMSALTHSFHHSRYPCITGQYPDFDLLQSIRSLSKTKITVAWQHVKGHQYRGTSPLTILEHHNTLDTCRYVGQRTETNSPYQHTIVPVTK